MDESERVELEADIEKIHHTLESDKSQWQFDYDYDSDDDSDDDEALYIDLDKHGSATVSLASASGRSAGGRTTPSVHSIDSRRTAESQSVTTDQDEDADQIFREVGVVLDKIDSTCSLPASLESCLIINRAYQDIIVEHISRIELSLAENREAQRKLEEEAKENTRQMMTKKKFQYSATTPYFKSSYGSTPQPNADVQLKKQAMEPDLDNRPESKWAARHKRLLIEAVKEDSLEKLLQPLLSRRELEEEKLLQVPEKSEEWNTIHDRIVAIDIEIDAKKTVSDELLLRDVDVDRVDWMKISNILFGGKRDWMSCKRAWMHHVDPKLNLTQFSEEETAKLNQLVKETKGRNWVYIAQQLGTGRTAFQCMQHYQQNLNTEKLQRPWTDQEDAKLVRVVDKCQQYHFNWHRVSQYMEGRSSTQCYKRFTKLDPKRSTGYWTEEEDAQLMAAVQLVGTSHWAKVQELVPGRTREQCRERYLNSLDPAISGEPWTYEQDRELIRGVEKYRNHWVLIAREFCPGRTDNQVLQRYRRLQDWKRKSEWFSHQTANTQRLLQGSALPDSKREEMRQKNWDQYRELFNVLPCDYEKQREDREKGIPEVPRPPFLLGLANRRCGKLWDQRMKLQRLIQEHVEKQRDRFETIDDSTTSGMYNLQDAITSLSREVLSRHKEQQRLAAELLSTRKPSAVSVGDMLAITRGDTVELNKPKVVRGPRQKKKKPRPMKRNKLHTVFKIDSELRRVMRTRMKSRSLKKGRPRRYFWDIAVDQGLAQEDLDMLRATAMNLYFKSLGANPGKLLATARQCFPDLAAKLQAQPQQTSGTHSSDEEEKEDRGPETADDGKPLRRSRRARKPKHANEVLMSSKQVVDAEQFMPEDHKLRRKRQDYELLEWMCGRLGIPAEHPPPEDICGEVEVGDSAGGQRAPELSGGDVEVSGSSGQRPTGMRQVDETIQQALRESIARQEAFSESSTINEPAEENAMQTSPGQSTGSGDAAQNFASEKESVQNTQGGRPAEPPREPTKQDATITESQEKSATEGPVQVAADQTEVQFGTASIALRAAVAAYQDALGTSTSQKNTVSVGLPQLASLGSDAASKSSENQSSAGNITVTGSQNSGDAVAGDTTDGRREKTAEEGVSLVTCSGDSATTTMSGRTSVLAGATTSSAATVHGSLVLECHESPLHIADCGERTFSVRMGPQQYRVFPKDASMVASASESGETKASQTTVNLVTSDDRQKFPNLPPTRISMQSFKLLLLKRLELIRSAGPYYSGDYYQAKKEAQMESLLRAGKHVQAVNRGSMDLSRLMNRVSQTAGVTGRGKYKRRKPGEQKFSDSPEFNALQIMNTVRESEEYKTLLSRFEAAFLWPAFLSAIYPPFQRHNFSQKALGSDPQRERDEEPGAGSFQIMRYKLPLLKSKRFYKFANKSREEKAAIVQKRNQKRILRQVQELMADEDDPNPQVSLIFNSDDEEDDGGATRTSSSNHAATSNHSSDTTTRIDNNDPQPSTSTAGQDEEASRVHKPKRRRRQQKPKDLTPARQSARAVKRIHYSDKLQAKKPKQPPRGPYRREVEGLPILRHMNRHARRHMINAMVEMQNSKGKRPHVDADLGGGGGGYVSDDVEAEEVVKSEDKWVWELPEAQKDSLLQLEMDVHLDASDEHMEVQ